MPGPGLAWIFACRIFRGCIRPDAVESLSGAKEDEYLRAGPLESLGGGGGRDCSLAKKSDPFSNNGDKASAASPDCFPELHIRETTPRRQSSSFVDALAPLAEDETLAPLDKILDPGLLVRAGATEAIWSEASRSSCPTVVAGGCASGAGLESPTSFGPSIVSLRPHSLASAPRSGLCVSPVSAATAARPLASPMRHDFMTLMKQANNRGSSSGVVTEATTAPYPHPFAHEPGSSGLNLDAHSSGAGARAATMVARQTVGVGRCDAVLDASRRRRQRRASAFTPGGAGEVERGATVDGGDGGTAPGAAAAGYCAPCPAPAGSAATPFGRCSSSPDMRTGGLLLAGAYTGTAKGVLQPLYTNPESTVQPMSGATSRRSCRDGGCDGSSCSVSGGGGGGGGGGPSLAIGVFRSCQAGAGGGGRNCYELRLPCASHSPLRPRDLPPLSATAVAAAAAATGGAVHLSPVGSSYQQVRLLQQLREHYELGHRAHKRAAAVNNTAAATAAASVAVAAAAAAAAAMGSSSPSSPAEAVEATAASRFPVRAGTADGGRDTEAIKWVQAYFVTEPDSCAGGEFPAPAAAMGGGGGGSNCAATAATGAAADLGDGAAVGATAPTAGHGDRRRTSVASSTAAFSDMLMHDSPSAALPSISAFLVAAAPESHWTDPSGGGGGDSWGGAAAATVAADSSALPVVVVPVLQPGVVRSVQGGGAVGGVLVTAATHDGDDGDGGDGLQTSQETSAAALQQQGVVVGSLGEAFTAASGVTARGDGGDGTSCEDAPSQAAAQAVLVIQNLLHRNALPDSGNGGDGGVSLFFMPTPTPQGHATSAPPPAGLGRGHGGPTGSDGSGSAAAAGGGSDEPRRGVCSSNARRLRAPPALDARSPRCGSAARCWPPPLGLTVGGETGYSPFSGGSGSGGSGGGCHHLPVKPPPVEPQLLQLPSRAASPAPDSLGGSGLPSRPETPLLICPQPSDRAAAAAAAGSLPVGSSGRLAADAPLSTPLTVCCSRPSHLLASPSYPDTPSSPTPAFHGLQASLSMQRLSGQPSCVAVGPAFTRNTAATATAGGSGSGVGDGFCETGAATSGSGGGAGEQSFWGGGAAAAVVYGMGAGGGAVAAMDRGRGSVSARRGSSVIASESSLAAIALLRSAASNCPLPDDGSGGGGSSRLSMLNAGVGAAAAYGGCTTTIPGGSLLGLDTTDGPSAAATAAQSGSLRSVTPPTADHGRCSPLSAIFANVALPSPLMLPPSPSPPSTSTSPAVHGSPAVQQLETGSAGTQSLRLEDGLVSDPLLLVDGLGQLSYITSGAFAAVYRGTLEGLPVGIKFLASTSLDLNAPAVKEALLGPGLEHENIIRTYTTRVARVDGRAVAQLRAVAAAMAAAAAATAALHRKRSSASARRFSSGAPAGCSPLSVPSTPLRAPPPHAAAGAGAATGVGDGAAAAATAAGHRRSAAGPLMLPTITAAQISGAPPSPSLLQGVGGAPLTCTSPQPTAATRVTPPPTPPAAAVAASAVGGGGGLSSLAAGHGRSQLPGQSSPARRVADSAPCNAVFTGAGTGTGERSAVHSLAASAAGGEPKTQRVSVLGFLGGQGSPGGAATAASGAPMSVAAAAAAPTTRHRYMRKSVSANARAEMAAYRPASFDAGDATTVVEAAAASVATSPAASPLSPRLSPASQHTLASAAAGGVAASRPPPRRGSAQALTGSGTPPLPQPGVRVGAVARTPAAAPRGGAAERMLDVLRTLSVVGPTGQPTAEAHYVTAVVMEFAEAGNLDTFSRTATSGDLATAVDLLRQVARGMSYLHAHGLVHGDLKPANVLLLRDPASGKLVAKVADFGLSGLSGQLGSTGGADTCGTVAYSAPERLTEEGTAEQAADVYSFGICMQQLVSGVRPFAELTFGQVMFSVLCLKQRPAWPEGKSGALQPLYDMCCDEQPARRPTFDQVVAWLDSLWPAAGAD